MIGGSLQVLLTVMFATHGCLLDAYWSYFYTAFSPYPWLAVESGTYYLFVILQTTSMALPNVLHKFLNIA